MDTREVFLLCWDEKASYEKEEVGSWSLGAGGEGASQCWGLCPGQGFPGMLVAPCATQLSKLSPSRSCLVQGWEL